MQTVVVVDLPTDISEILVNITSSVNSPDNQDDRAMVLKSNPSSVPNENKNSISYISYFLIATTIILLALTAVFSKEELNN
jgi:presenilin-like A22 family membrane protease